MTDKEQPLIRAFQYAPFPVIIHNEDGQVLFINERFSDITGYQYDEIDTIKKWTYLAYGEKMDVVKPLIDRLFSIDKIMSEGEFKIRTKTGEYRYWEFSSGPFGVDENNRRQVISMAMDVTERKEMEEKLEHLASHDGLTGLYTRNVLIQRLEHEIVRAERYQHNISVFIIDIDHFKAVNDDYGHVAGDDVLKSFAALLQRTIRTTDYIARYGGEEFVMVLPETNSDEAIELADRLRKIIEKHTITIEDKQVSITASIGIACYPKDAASAADLFKLADEAMYKVKRSGRNAVAMA